MPLQLSLQQIGQVQRQLELPENPSAEELLVLQKYLAVEKKRVLSEKETGGYGKQNFYQEKKELYGKKLIIFKHKQKKSGGWYMRLYLQKERKYKIISLRTTDDSVAVERALEKWRFLQNHMDVGGDVFESPTQETIDDYMKHLDSLVETEQMKKHTIQAKRTSIKKLRLYLGSYLKPSEIPSLVLDDYVMWRRTKNWDKKKHKNNPKPPSDLTINKELCDFKGYFDWMKKKKKFGGEIEYPFLKVDWNKSIEKNPSFADEDWRAIVMYLRTWVKKETNSRGEKRKVFFYRTIFAEFMKVLANSGMRIHECMKLRWSDIELRKKIEISQNSGRERERIISHIEIAPDTKTGRRLVICPAGIYFKRIRELYREKEGKAPKRDDFIFRNIGTIHSRANLYVGMPLSAEFFRKLWYELIEDIEYDKDITFDSAYTLQSCRAFYINKRLEMGVPPAIVAELVGHSIKTMERYYKNIRLKQLEPELVEVRRKKLEEEDFQTFDLD